jgi:hypothetical protein
MKLHIKYIIIIYMNLINNFVMTVELNLIVYLATTQ